MTNNQPLNPQLCPICGEPNICGNLAAKPDKSCWCYNPEIQFTDALLKQVPTELKGKACICMACATKYNKQAN